MSLDQYSAHDYVNAFRRRSRWFFSIFVAIASVAVTTAVVLPDQYRSGAEMAINLEGPNIELVEPLILTAYADQYVKSLEQKVLTSSNLRAWLAESNAYASDRGTVSDGELIRRIRENIQINMVFTSVMDQRTGKEVELITGFTTSFFSSSPEAAQIIANNLAMAFLAGDKAMRVERAETASSFLLEQIEQENDEIISLEGKIAKFKQDNAGELPEFMVMNMTVLERTTRDLEGLITQISALQQDRVFRQAQLDDIRNKSGAGSLLAQLEQEYLRAVAIYGPDHPDVVRINRQMAAVMEQNTRPGNTAEIDQLELQLAEARQKYTAAHPDVVSLERRLGALRAESSSELDSESQDATYLQLRAQLNAIDTNLAALRERENDLRQKQQDLEIRVANTPQVERRFQALSRDLQTAQLAFDDLRQRLAQAQQTESFESGERGARLELVRNARVPIEPAGPQRIAIVVLGAFLGLVLGGGAAIVMEMTDNTIRGSKDIQVVLNTRPIVAVPIVQNSLSRSHRRRQLIALTTGAVLVGTIIFIFYSRLGS